jgi:hypothetical protein
MRSVVVQSLPRMSGRAVRAGILDEGGGLPAHADNTVQVTGTVNGQLRLKRAPRQVAVVPDLEPGCRQHFEHTSGTPGCWSTLVTRIVAPAGTLRQMMYCQLAHRASKPTG